MAAAPSPKDQAPTLTRSYFVPFLLVTTCFALWGFANDITNPMVKAFSKILLMTNFEGSLVQFAFYGGYFAMAFPAAMFIKKFSYKAGLLMGLSLYAIGALLFFPASLSMTFALFLMAYFVMTCGLSFLETSANPYIMSMGDQRTATRRLNFAQAFNPVGSLLGMFVAQQLILAQLFRASRAEREELAVAAPDEFARITAHDLEVIRTPYLGIALVILVVLVAIAITRMPRNEDTDRRLNLGPALQRLLSKRRYVEGVIAQFFYVGAQIMCWTFILHYGTELFVSQGMEEQAAETRAQQYNIAAMVLFVSSRFLCTYLLKFVSPGKLLGALACGGILLTLGTIFLPGMAGLYALVGVSGCMSLMFPTIYGLALHGVGEDAKYGAAGLIMAILGGSVLPPMQGAITDFGSVLGISAVRVSFLLPLVCFVVIAAYGFRQAREQVTEPERPSAP